MRYHQVFDKRFYKSGILINVSVLNAAGRTEKGENIPYLASLKALYFNKGENNTLGEYSFGALIRKNDFVQA